MKTSLLKLLTAAGRCLARWGTVSILLSGLAVEGAEFRTTTGDRAVHRQVSYNFAARQQPTPELNEHETPDFIEDAEPYEASEWLDQGELYGPPGGWHPCECGIWADAEFLVWWRRGQDLPPLVTTAPAGTSLANAGVLGQNSTTVLFGGESEGGRGRPGGRLTLGTWLDACHATSVMGRFYGLGDEELRYSLSSNNAGSPIIAIPFFDAVLNRENSLVLAYPTAPDQRVGSVTITGNSEVYGAEALFRRRFYEDPILRLDWVLGYQHSRINEDLRIQGTSTVGNQFRQTPEDFFSTKNEFHGAAIGMSSDYDRGCWRMTGMLKVGLGNMNETLEIRGRNSVEAPPGGAAAVQNAGLFAQASNSGTFLQDEFVVVPEANLNFSWFATDRVNLTFGYSFIYWSHVLRPGSELDRRVDDTGATPVPAVRLDSQGFWVQGLNFGSTVRF